MKLPHLLQHRKRFWYDRAIPRHLRAVLRKTRYRINLKTSNLQEALALLPKCEASFVMEVARAEKHLKSTLDPVARAEDLALALREASLEPDEHGPSIYVDRDEAEAVEAKIEPPLREYFADLVMGRAPKRMTELIDGYLATQNHLAPGTFMERRTTLEKLMRWSAANGVINPLKFSRAHAKAFLASLPGQAPTIAKALQAPLGLWRYMAEEGLSVEPEIWKGLAPKKSQREQNENHERAFTLPELEKLFEGPAKPLLRDAMLLSLFSGMRLAELGYLRVEHVDLERQTVTVPGGKTHNAYRIIPMHDKLVGLLRQRTTGKAPLDFVLHELGDKSLKHGRKRSAALSQAFTRYRESVGVREDRDGKRRSLVNFHSLRRCGDKAMIEHHPPIAPHVIDAFFGWSDQGKMRARYAVGADLMAQMRTALNAFNWPITR